MKRNTIFALLAFAVLTAVPAMGFAGIVGSPHDFTGQGFSQGQICLPCHAPHNTETAVVDVPLWNHTVSTAIYALYTSDTFDAGLPAGQITQPRGLSKLCLSCHDGTVAIDAFGGTAGTEFIGGRSNLGTDLSNDHPVSFVYDTALSAADGTLHDPTSTLSGLPGSTGTIRQDMLFGDFLECSSCHDVHNRFENETLLKKGNAGSALCLTCHNK